MKSLVYAFAIVLLSLVNIKVARIRITRFIYRDICD